MDKTEAPLCDVMPSPTASGVPISPGSYQVVDDEGRQHTVVVFVQVLSGTNLDGTTWRTDGLQSHKMAANGNHVNVNKEEGTVQEVAKGRVMRRA